jgi:hypothetical protein
MTHTAELPPDPDNDDMPAGLDGLNGKTVWVLLEKGGPPTPATLLATAPHYAFARRMREGFYDDLEDEADALAIEAEHLSLNRGREADE